VSKKPTSKKMKGLSFGGREQITLKYGTEAKLISELRDVGKASISKGWSSQFCQREIVGRKMRTRALERSRIR